MTEKKYAWGGRAFFTPFPSHGTVSLVGSVKGGSRAVCALLPEASLGEGKEFAEIHADMLLEGTEKQTKEEIRNLLDDMGASLSFSTTRERLIFTGRARTPHIPRLLALIAEILTLPAFPSTELTVLKKREEAEFTLTAQDTRIQAGIHLSRLLFPAGHPNRAESIAEEKAILSRTTTRLLREYHKKSLSRASLIISLSGDIHMASLASLIEKNFKKLPKGEYVFKEYDTRVASTRQHSSLFIPDKAGIDYMLGIPLSLSRMSKDYPALLLGIQIFGHSGFTGRLMQRVREKEGLTYGAYSSLAGFEGETEGYLHTWTSFAPQLFDKGQKAMLRELNLLVKEGVTAEEVKKHRTLFDASFRVRLSSPGALARAVHDTVVGGYPLSHLDTFPKKILALTRGEVNRALRKYVVLDNLAESSAGPVEKEPRKK